MSRFSDLEFDPQPAVDPPKEISPSARFDLDIDGIEMPAAKEAGISPKASADFHFGLQANGVTILHSAQGFAIPIGIASTRVGSVPVRACLVYLGVDWRQWPGDRDSWETFATLKGVRVELLEGVPRDMEFLCQALNHPAHFRASGWRYEVQLWACRVCDREIKHPRSIERGLCFIH